MTTAGSMTFLGHATIQLTLPDERVIIIDPWLRDNPSCPDKRADPPRCDFIALTHAHSDHIDDVDRLIQNHNPQVIATIELCELLGMRNPKTRCAPMNIGGTQTVDGVDFTLTQAFHSSGFSSENGPQYAGMPAGIIISAAGVASFYHAGDTDVFGDMKLIAELFAPKIAALPIGDHFTMGPKGAAIAAKLLTPDCIVPMHFGTFPQLHGTVDAFRDALPADLRGRLIVPAVGESVGWTTEGLSIG